MPSPELMGETTKQNEATFSHRPIIESATAERIDQGENKRVFYDEKHQEICDEIDSFSSKDSVETHNFKEALKNELETVILQIRTQDAHERLDNRMRVVQAFHEMKNKFCTDNHIEAESPEYQKLNLVIADSINSYLHGLVTDLAIAEAMRHDPATDSNKKRTSS